MERQQPIPLYTGQSVKQLDTITIEKIGIPGFELMTRAAQAAFKVLRSTWPSAKVFAIVCGTGNNGGDGYALAKLLVEDDLNVLVYQVGGAKAALSETAELARKDFLQTGQTLQSLPDSGEFQADVLVDAVLGTGLRAPLKPEWLAAIQLINQSHKPVLAIDIPSGLDGNTGAIVEEAIVANVTITFIGIKLALLSGPALDYVGQLSFDSLGVPSEVYQRVQRDGETLELIYALKALPRREPSAHKGKMGHVLVIGGGSLGYSGAACLASSAALSSGAGLVSSYVHPEAVALMSRAPMEVMCHSQEQALSELIQRATVLVVGPGLTTTDWAKQQFEVLLKSDLPMIVDADALNLLSKNPTKRDNWILTPHPGEAARLLNVSTQAVQADRLGSAKRLQEKFGGIIVLKGAGTLIACEEHTVYVCTSGNPGMASGGMGDILSGLIGGLVAQGLNLLDAAKLAVITHGEAADLEQSLGERGMLASELLLHIRTLLNPFEDHEQPTLQNIFDFNGR